MRTDKGTMRLNEWRNGVKEGTFGSKYREAKGNREEERETDITSLEQYMAGLALFLV